MKLPFDILSQNYTKPKLFLCNVDKQKICELETTELSGSFKFNTYSELNFTVPRTYTNMITGETDVNPHYNKIEALRLVLLEGFGYFEIQEPEITSDGIREAKNVTAYSLEYTLSQKYIEDLYVNTGEAKSVEVIVAGNSRIIPVTLYNKDKPELSLLDLALEKIYGWSIGHVDDSLLSMSRQFEISRASVYDFIVRDVCEKFNCYAVFDTIDNKINLYAEALISKFIGDGKTTSFTLQTPYANIESVTIDSYRTTEYIYEIIGDGVITPEVGVLTFINPPANGAMVEVTDGSQKAWATDVYVTFDNLAQEVSVNYSAEDIKTVLTVKGQDDFGIHEVNMGIPYITDLSYYYSIDWMGQELYDAYTIYMQNVNNEQNEYQDNSEKMFVISDHVLYETNRLSLQYSKAINVTDKTVGSYYILKGTEDEGYYYIEVTLPEDWKAGVDYYTLSGSDLNETKFSKFYEALKKYYASQDENNTDAINELKDDFSFMKENTIDHLVDILKNAKTSESKDVAVKSFFDELFDQLGLTPLKKLYYEPYKEIKKTNEEAGWNNTNNENYWNYYPVLIVLNSLEKEIKDREDLILDYENEYKILSDRNSEISKNASMDVFFKNYYKEQGFDDLTANTKAIQLLIKISPFLREDEYTDDNFAEYDTDDIETIMQHKKELLECGKVELQKLSSPKLSFSMSMANIYALPEFDPIIDQFQLGKLINVAIRLDYVKRARLLSVNINFDDFSDFTCEFGELTNLKTPSSIHADLLASALTAGKSVASSQSYWEKGADLATSTDIKIQNGLLGAIDGIYNGDKSVLIDNHGILLRKVNENGEYDPYQIWLTNNNILVSTDYFHTAQTGIGVFEVDGRELYGVLAKAVLSGYIESSTIVGGKINIGDGAFVVNEDGTVTMNAKGNTIDGYAKTQSVEVVEAQISNIIDSQINNNNNTIISSSEPENPSYSQLWLDTSFTPSRLKIFMQVEGQEYGEWVDCTEHLGQNVYTLKPMEYSVGDLWILSSGETCGNFGPGSMLKATVSSNTFNQSHWIDADEEYTELKNNIQQYFGFDPNTGLRIGQTDNKFYVNINSSEMGFYDNSEGQNQKVVSIGNNAATIKDLTVEDDAEFNCNATFNKQVQFGNFVWQIESNGSLSLAVMN